MQGVPEKHQVGVSTCICKEWRSSQAVNVLATEILFIEPLQLCGSRKQVETLNPSEGPRVWW